jgi:hypothetical protein
MTVNELQARTSETRNASRERRVIDTGLVPQPGDVVASRTTARSDDCAIRILPDAAYAVTARYAEAIATVRQRASLLRVDGWYTADHTHFVQVARCRP